MAIAFNTTSSGFVGSGTSMTFSHTTSGTNRGLVVCVLGSVNDATDVVTGTTYNGVSMTFVKKYKYAGTPNYLNWMYVYYLTNPAVGAHDVVVSASSSITMYGYATSYTGCHQAIQPLTTTASENNATTSFSNSVTTAVENSWVVGFVLVNTYAISAGADTTLRIGAGSTVVIADSNAPRAVGSNSLNYTSSSSNAWEGIIFEIRGDEITNNIVSYWKLDESSGNAADSVGSNTLTNNNSTPFVAGKINNGADLENGSSHSFSQASPSELNITSSLTVNAWIKPESLSGDTSVRIILSKFFVTTRAYYFGISGTDDGSGNDNTMLVARLGNTAGSAATNYFSNTAAVSAGSFVMATFVFDDSSDLVRFYINGSTHGTTAKTDLIGSNSAPLYIGADYNGGTPNQFFDGIIDEVGIWSRALSSTEVTSLYNNGSGLAYPFLSATFIPTVMIF